MRRFARFAILLPLLTLLSCASTSELVRRGEVALDAGNAGRAYDWARRALEREPGNPHAREIMTAAATLLMGGRRAAIMDLAQMDTLAAARASLELDGFRAELASHHVTLAPDPELRGAEAALRIGAAHIYYVKGVASLRDRYPKRAWAELTEGARFAPGYADLQAQLDRAFQQAVTRIAILPFNDEVSEPEVTRQVFEDVFGQMQYQLGARRFRFTRLISRDRVEQNLSVAQAGRLSRDEAVRLGRALGAQRVVLARIHDLRSDTHTDTYHENVFRKVTERGEDGASAVRYKEVPFEAVARWRNVSIVLDLEVLETEDGGLLARDSEPRRIGAHTVFTRFAPPTAASDEYCLVPPAETGTDFGKSVEKEWRGLFGSWTLSGLIDRSRRDSGRTRYEPRYRGDFRSAGTSTPVWLDDVPPVGELAYLALADAWMPMLEMLKDLDGKDDLEIVTGRNGE